MHWNAATKTIPRSQKPVVLQKIVYLVRSYITKLYVDHFKSVPVYYVVCFKPVNETSKIRLFLTGYINSYLNDVH